MPKATRRTEMSTYRLIDTDTREIVTVAASEAEALAACPYLPSDCVPEAVSWEEVLEVARQHADGIPGVVDGYAVERVEEGRDHMPTEKEIKPMKMRMSKPLACLVTLLLPACVFAAPAKVPAEKCAPYTLNGKPVVAKRTAAGNLSTTACEPEITVRLRAGKPDGRALKGAIAHKAGAGIILRKVTMTECTVWVYEDARRPDADTVLRAWDLCIDSMHHALEEAVSK